MKLHPSSSGIRSTLLGMVVNAMLVIVKGAAGFLGNSYVLIADAIESTSDIFSSIVVLAGLKIAAKPPDIDHPYGHGKAEPLAATFVALALIAAAIIIAIQSTLEIKTPHHAPESFTLFVLIGVVATKELMFRYVNTVGTSVNSLAVKTDAWHHRSDALTSLAAFVGISIALIGGKGYESADDWAAIFVSLVIVFNAFRLFRPAVAELMDTSPDPEVEHQVRRVASAVAGVTGLDKCFVRKVGFEFYVDLHVEVDGGISVREGHEIGHNVKDAVRGSNPRIADVLVHIEPF